MKCIVSIIRTGKGVFGSFYGPSNGKYGAAVFWLHEDSKGRPELLAASPAQHATPQEATAAANLAIDVIRAKQLPCRPAGGCEKADCCAPAATVH